MNMGRAYCNLGLAHMALGNLETALECQLRLVRMTQHLQGKFRHWARDRSLEAAACGAGIGPPTSKTARRWDTTLRLTLRQEAGDAAGRRAHSPRRRCIWLWGTIRTLPAVIGTVGTRTRTSRTALWKLKPTETWASLNTTWGNTKMPSDTRTVRQSSGIGLACRCYDAGDPDETIKYHEQHLALALKLNNSESRRAYRGLGLSHKSVGNLQQALVCLEKRLVVSHELGMPEAKAQAYGEWGLDGGGSDTRLGVAQAARGDTPPRCATTATSWNWHRLGLTHLQARAAASGAGAAMGAHAEAALAQARLRHASAAGDVAGRAQALAELGRAHLAMGAWRRRVLPQAGPIGHRGLAISDEECAIDSASRSGLPANWRSQRSASGRHGGTGNERRGIGTRDDSFIHVNSARFAEDTRRIGTKFGSAARSRKGSQQIPGRMREQAHAGLINIVSLVEERSNSSLPDVGLDESQSYGTISI
ncbi:Tetratricopeptide repeat protein 28 [Eumeta japonica]|uniref:Tetratricopeptide repeat protein 28 n=1 Tax=Eumeta variegata TaxID=151549 RepID=A0A4C2A8K2_EUMVA|nr:Tetratricopeptide repeat protein 28 [Eumeta japonica]